MRILYIGAPDVQHSIITALSQVRGEYEVLLAINKDEFTRALEGRGPGLILYDCCTTGIMPLDQVLMYARALHLPVVTIASIHDAGSAQTAIETGIVGCVFKEHLGQLAFTLSNIAEKARLEREKADLHKKLQRTERQHRTLLGSINEFIFLFNEKGDLVYQSPSANQLSGFSDLEGRQVFEYIYPDDRKKFFYLFRQVLRKPGARVEGQFRIQHKAGHYIWIEGSVANLVSDDSINAFVLSCRDVSERKAAEKDLMQINRLYSVINHINQAIVTVQDEQNLFKAACRIATEHGGFKMAYIGLLEGGVLRLAESSGLTEDEKAPFREVPNIENSPLDGVLQTGRYYVCNNIQRDHELEYWRYIAAQKGFSSFIVLPVRKLGRIVATFVLAAAETDFFSDKEIHLLEEAATDISFKLDVLEKEKSRLQAEEALRESESRYSTLFHDSPQPKWLYDPETFRFVKVNKAAVEKYGYSEEEFLAMTIFDIRPREDCERVRTFMTRSINRNEIFRDRHFRHYTKAGELIDVEIYSSLVVLNDKAYKMVIAIDITAINKHEDMVTSAIIQAQEKERYEIGSELHDNVCQILATSLLKLSMLHPAIQADVAGTYKESKDNILLAIKEVRNISHRLAPASFNDSTLEDSVKLLISTYSAYESLDIALFVTPSINECKFTNEIKLNLFRIIQEQLSNIVKHAGATHVVIRLLLVGQELRMTIADNGVGFDVGAVRGGIGLTNMKRRVELFQGEIDIESSPGDGCKVIVMIPLERMLDESHRLDAAMLS